MVQHIRLSMGDVNELIANRLIANLEAASSESELAANALKDVAAVRATTPAAAQRGVKMLRALSAHCDVEAKLDD